MNTTFQQARNFLNPAYREAKYKYTDEQMEKMISTVSKRIQQELTNVTSKGNYTQSANLAQSNSIPIQSLKSQNQNNDMNTSDEIDPSSEKQTKSKTRHVRRKSKQSEASNHPFIVNSSVAEYSNPADQPHAISDDNCSYNDNSDDDPFMMENSSQKQESELKSMELKTPKQSQQNNANKQLTVQVSTPVETKPKRVIHIPEEPQKQVEIGVKFRTPIQTNQKPNQGNIRSNNSNENDNSRQKPEVESSSKGRSEHKKEVVINRDQDKNTRTPISNNAAQKPSEEHSTPKCYEITNQELNELLKESTEPEEEIKSRPEITEKPKSVKKKKIIKTPRKNKENDNNNNNINNTPVSTSNTTNNKSNLFNNSAFGQKLEENKKYVDCGGVKITNSELEELLCESSNKNDENTQDSKILTKTSANDTFYQGIEDDNDEDNNKKSGFSPEEIADLLKNESFNDADNINYDDISNLKELPKPQKSHNNDSKFDLSYLNDIPGPDEFEQMRKQKQEQQDNQSAPKSKRLLSLGAILPETANQNGT